MDGRGDVGVTAAAQLMVLADAAIRRDDETILQARTLVVSALGELAMLDAAAVIGGFDGITRIADATGIPLEPAKAEQSTDFRMALEIDRFQREKS
jgi:hypothetical protein